ncbi:hypothetical protein U1E44_14310 [Arenibacter sp. GZD96]|uniref:hypothetical protein n=1 Tax=Aurantibrevibacter litoralis TaxID=3106030 RepID=UPI002AFE2F61|nr:hypothetical protein [Arenibacter sp. GZD-96]MEA1787271.1 hypothetical protein [Arenibacter sp. GZD-96]
MQEDLKHIELIDKYLRNALNPSEKVEVEKLLDNDSDFAKEVMIYEKIYEGITKKGETDLKNRLRNYYKEYNTNRETDTAHKPTGKYRRLFIYGGSIAACLIVGGAILFFNNNDPSASNTKPIVVDVDTTSTKKPDSIFDVKEEILVEETPKNDLKIDQVHDNDGLVNQENANEPKKEDSIQSLDIDNEVQLAFGGFKTLHSSAIRRYEYAKSLSYTFYDGVFKLYGDPLIGKLEALSLRIVKNGESGYFLKYKNDYYELHETEYRLELKRLVKKQDNQGVNTLFTTAPKLIPSKENVILEIVGVQKSSTELSELLVRIDTQRTIEKTYFFKKGQEHLELILNADLDQEEAKVYRIEEGGKYHYFLVQENQIYALDESSKRPTPLITVDITTNKLARLFMKREPIKTVVYKEK